VRREWFTEEGIIIIIIPEATEIPLVEDSIIIPEETKVSLEEDSIIIPEVVAVRDGVYTATTGVAEDGDGITAGEVETGLDTHIRSRTKMWSSSTIGAEARTPIKTTIVDRVTLQQIKIQTHANVGAVDVASDVAHAGLPLLSLKRQNVA
jgi:hypothetical protein